MIDINKFDKFIVGNWKLNGNKTFCLEYIELLKANSRLIDKNRCIVICPPNPYLNFFKNSNVYLGSQDLSLYNEGAYTGEISSKILKDVGCNFSLVGHSERRSFFSEKKDILKTKVINCINHQIIPILCIGETENQKNNNQTFEIIEQQIYDVLSDIINDTKKRAKIAEPPSHPTDDHC